MRVRVPLAVVTLLAWFVVAAWWASGVTDSEIAGAGIWPGGWATIALMLAAPRLRPLVVLAVVVATFWIIDQSELSGVAAGWAVAVGLETVMAAVILSDTVRAGRRPTLTTNRDLVVFLAAGSLSAGAGAMIAGSVAFVAGIDGWYWATFAYAANHMAGQWLLVPLLCHLPPSERLAGAVESLVMAVSFGVLCVLTFGPPALSIMLFMFLPYLTWIAARLSTRQALTVLLGAVCVVGVATWQRRGPLADLIPAPSAPDGLQYVVTNAFLVACLLVVLTLSLAVGQQREVSNRAFVELDRLSSIVNSSHGVAIVGTDSGGDITLFNPGAERLLGYRAVEVIGKNSDVLFADRETKALMRDFGAHTRAEFIDMISEPGMHGLDMKLVRKDGVVRTFSMTMSRVFDDRGRLTGYVSTSEDVTERVEAAGLLRDALISERKAGERLREIDAVKDAFVSSVSHELRTPLTSIAGYLELLDDGTYGELADPQANAVRRISDNSRRLLALIDDLLTLSRVEESGRSIIVSDFDLCDAVRSAFEVVRPQWVKRDLAARLLIAPDSLAFRGSRDMVERIVVNLLGNAVKFTPDGGWITVELVREGDQAVLRVSDSGIGIKPADLDRLFERFFRASQAEAIPGSGLGLSITRAMVEKHRGTIEVTSESGVGTTFEVRLPVAPGVDMRFKES
ncbi:MAG: PAS domain-containing sensor histidine kinase [Nocardioides sp.]